MFINMRKTILTIFLSTMFGFVFLGKANSEDKNIQNQNTENTELNFFTGMFDYSDNGQASGLLGFQHQNEDLYRESFLGKLSPITGGFLTEKSAFYLYTGAQAEFNLLNLPEASTSDRFGNYLSTLPVQYLPPAVVAIVLLGVVPVIIFARRRKAG